MSLVISRQLISDLCAKLPSFDPEHAKVICNFSLEKLQSRAISFEEQVYFEILYASFSVKVFQGKISVY